MTWCRRMKATMPKMTVPPPFVSVFDFRCNFVVGYSPFWYHLLIRYSPVILTCLILVTCRYNHYSTRFYDFYCFTVTGVTLPYRWTCHTTTPPVGPFVCSILFTVGVLFYWFHHVVWFTITGISCSGTPRWVLTTVLLLGVRYHTGSFTLRCLFLFVYSDRTICGVHFYYIPAFQLFVYTPHFHSIHITTVHAFCYHSYQVEFYSGTPFCSRCVPIPPPPRFVPHTIPRVLYRWWNTHSSYLPEPLLPAILILFYIPATTTILRFLPFWFLPLSLRLYTGPYRRYLWYTFLVLRLRSRYILRLPAFVTHHVAFWFPFYRLLRCSLFTFSTLRSFTVDAPYRVYCTLPLLIYVTFPLFGALPAVTFFLPVTACRYCNHSRSFPLLPFTTTDPLPLPHPALPFVLLLHSFVPPVLLHYRWTFRYRFYTPILEGHSPGIWFHHQVEFVVRWCIRLPVICSVLRSTVLCITIFHTHYRFHLVNPLDTHTVRLVLRLHLPFLFYHSTDYILLFGGLYTRYRYRMYVYVDHVTFTVPTISTFFELPTPAYQFTVHGLP